MRHTAPDHLRIGILQTILHDSDRVLTTDLVCCVHCGYIWQFAAGSKRLRGWCGKCNGFLCGRRYCREQVPCRHWLHGIDALERGLPIETAPALKILVGG